jgi:photosystem II stability/assembly factor-like uncharacterized protein
MGILRGSVFAFCWLAHSVCAVAGTNTWTVISRDGGSVNAMTYLTNTPGVAIATAGYSLYRTSDNGATWAEIRRLEYTYRNMARDPSNANRVVMVGQNSLSLITEDGGLTFSAFPRFGDRTNDFETAVAISTDGQVWYGGTANGLMYRSLDRGQTWEMRSTGLSANSHNQILRIQIDPANPQRVYILRRDVAANIYVTTNGGESWVSVANVCITGCLDLSLNPHATSELIAASFSGIFRSADSGGTWTQRDARPMSLARFDPLVANRVIAMSELNEVVRSVDGGLTFGAGFPLRTPLPWALDFDQHVPGRVYLAASSGGFLSEDGGATWSERTNGMRGNSADRLVSTGTPGRTYAVGGILRTPAVSQFDAVNERWTTLGQASIDAISRSIFFRSLGVAEGNPALLYGGSFEGLFRSLDAGATWQRPSAVLNTESPGDMAVAPNDPNTVYVAVGDAVWVSHDGGVSFPVRTTVAGANSIVLAIDPRDSSTAYLGSINVPAGVTVLYKTVNGGSTWTAANAGLEAVAVRRIKIDPANSAIVYAATELGLYKSVNAGAAWTRLPGQESVEDVDIDVFEPMHLIRTGAIAQRNRVERSVDGGESWERLALGYTDFGRAAVFDRTRPATIIVALLGSIESLQIAPDLELTSATPAIAAASSENVRLSVRNRGPFAATQVALTGVIPGGDATLATDHGSCTASAGAVRCELGALRSDATATIDVDLPEMASGSVRFSVEGRQPDVAMANNEITLNVERRSNVAVTLTSATSSVQTGGSIGLTIAATNGDLSPAEDVRVTLELPSTLQWDGASPSSSSSCTTSGRLLTCTLGSLSRSSSTQLSATARALTAGSALVSASITAAGTDPVPSNNAASVTIVVADPPAPPPAASKGGGGGSFGWLFGMCLFALACAPQRIRLT